MHVGARGDDRARKAAVAPDLDLWLDRPALRIVHSRSSRASAEQLWSAAREVERGQIGLLGRLVRWRIPGTRAGQTLEELFTDPPFSVLAREELGLVCGLVGRIWTLRRDYPRLKDPEDFLDWCKRGTARVAFAHWVEPAGAGSALHIEARVQAFGAQGRVGLAVVRPLIRSFQHLIGTEGIAAAVRHAEGVPTLSSSRRGA